MAKAKKKTAKTIYYWACKEDQCPVFACPVETTSPVICRTHNQPMSRISAQQAGVAL